MTAKDDLKAIWAGLGHEDRVRIERAYRRDQRKGVRFERPSVGFKVGKSPADFHDTRGYAPYDLDLWWSESEFNSWVIGELDDDGKDVPKKRKARR